MVSLGDRRRVVMVGSPYEPLSSYVGILQAIKTCQYKRTEVTGGPHSNWREAGLESKQDKEKED